MIHFRRPENVYRIAWALHDWKYLQSINIAVPHGAEPLDDARLPESANIVRGLPDNLSIRYDVARNCGADYHLLLDDDHLIDDSWVRTALPIVMKHPLRLIGSHGRVPLVCQSHNFRSIFSTPSWRTSFTRRDESRAWVAR